MKGLYLYCIGEKNNTEFSTEGIGGGKIFAIPYQDLEAVVSEVSLEEFGSDEIQRKAQEDLNWIKEKALSHERIIEEAMGIKLKSYLDAVIPMQFGVIFKTKESLVESLTRHYQQFQESLKKLKGKQEWGVKVFLKENIFRKTIEEKNRAVLAKKKEIKSMSKGMAFFAQKQINGIVSQEKDKELDRIMEEIYGNLGVLSFSQNKAKLLKKDFTGREEEMVLNSFYLVEKSKLNQFQKRVEGLKGKYNFLGLEIILTGPWPSYHFA